MFIDFGIDQLFHIDVPVSLASQDLGTIKVVLWLLLFCFCIVYVMRSLPPVPTAPPQKVEVKFEKNGTLHLSWQPPPVSEINGPIRGYKVSLHFSWQPPPVSEINGHIRGYKVQLHLRDSHPHQRN